MTQPITSSNQQPGFIPNPTALGIATHQKWMEAFVDWWASRWAHGDHTLPAGFDPAKFGTPDPNDSGGSASAATMLALSRYAAAYKPGLDPNVDNTIPWVAPGPNDFIEDPVQTAARVAQNNWERTFGQTATNNDRIAWQNAFTAEVSKYSTAGSIFATQEQFKNSLFGTQASMYNANENNRVGALSHAGTLAQALQSLYDTRTQNAINLQANPNDFMAREYAVRALNGPIAKDVPGYQNVDALSEVIRRLIDYTPGAQPQAPAPGTSPVAPVNTSFKEWQTANGSQNTVPSAPPPNTTPGQPPQVVKPVDVVVPGVTKDDGTDQSGNKWSAEGPNQSRWTDTHGNYSDDGGKTWSNGTKAFARGTLGTTVHRMIIGDPQADMRPNPELVEISGQNVKTKVTPLKNGIKGKKGKAKAMAYGDPSTAPNVSLKSYDDSAYQNLPSLKYMQGGTDRATYNTLASGTAAGGFGTRVPESGSINYGKYLDVARDPLSLAMLSSVYRSANRDLASEVARAKERAPFGQAVQTTLIRS